MTTSSKCTLCGKTFNTENSVDHACYSYKDEIKIGPLIYRVEHVENLFNDDDLKIQGRLQYEICRMQIESRSNKQVIDITMLHEILHGILNNSGSLEHDEKMIDTLAHGLYGVIIDNWALIKQIRERGETY